MCHFEFPDKDFEPPACWKHLLFQPRGQHLQTSVLKGPAGCWALNTDGNVHMRSRTGHEQLKVRSDCLGSEILRTVIKNHMVPGILRGMVMCKAD